MIHRRRLATALPLLAILFLFNNDRARISAQTLYRVSIQQSVSVKMRDGVSFQERGRLSVTDGSLPVGNLNELEFVGGEIYANVWHTDRIARISPESGRIVGWINLTGLLPKVYQLEPEAVLNGIAYDAAGDRLFVTGKLWPKLFEITLERRP